MSAAGRDKSSAKGTWRHDAWGVWMLVWSWGPALAAIALAARHPSPWSYLAALVVVGARQHALFVVAHESWHKTVFRSPRWNRFAGAWLAAYPVVIPWVSARETHLEHHRKVGTEADPDRYAWSWRRSERGAFAWHLAAVATGVPFVVRAVRQALGLPLPPPRDGMPVPTETSGGRGEQLRTVATHLVLLGAFAGTVGWVWYFALWLFPAISMRLFFEALRQFLEHRGGRMHLYRSGPVERFFLGPFNFHLHPYHHALASEPWFSVRNAAAKAAEKYEIVEHASYVGELVAYFRGAGEVAEVERPPADAHGGG